MATEGGQAVAEGGWVAGGFCSAEAEPRACGASSGGAAAGGAALQAHSPTLELLVSPALFASVVAVEGAATGGLASKGGTAVGGRGAADGAADGTDAGAVVPVLPICNGSERPSREGRMSDQFGVGGVGGGSAP